MNTGQNILHMYTFGTSWSGFLSLNTGGRFQGRFQKNIMGSYFVGVVAKAPPMWLVVQLCEVEGGPAIGFWICMTFAKGFTH